MQEVKEVAKGKGYKIPFKTKLAVIEDLSKKVELVNERQQGRGERGRRKQLYKAEMGRLRGFEGDYSKKIRNLIKKKIVTRHKIGHGTVSEIYTWNVL